MQRACGVRASQRKASHNSGGNWEDNRVYYDYFLYFLEVIETEHITTLMTLQADYNITG